MQDYIKDLNDVQQQAVVNYKGPTLVIAGAGSGKTRVLTYRIAYLLDQGVRAGKILSLTFTNKAAKEMKVRISSLVGEENAKYLWMGTFHSIFSRILRQECEAIGYPSSFTIYDSQDSKNLIKKIVKDLNLDEKIYKPNVVLNRISSAKNNLITPGAYVVNATIMGDDRSSNKPMIGEVYKMYAQRCFKSGVMDFDDLLLYTNILFRDHPEILKKYQHKFDYILVDEYQDTNFSQYLIVKKLAEMHNNVCVVGDDAQSIYSFRGAKIENILNFKNDYPNYQIHKLEQNYRSTQNIVNAANSIIAKNKDQIQKDVWSDNEAGNKIKVIKALTDNEEGYIIANSIIDKRYSEHCEFNDFAILYRTNAQSRIFEEALRKKNIPYKMYGGISFYQRKEIKDLLSYFRLVTNNTDNEAFKRIINYPVRGIGKTTVDKLENFSNFSEISLWEIAKNIQSTPIGFNKGTVAKIKSFYNLVSDFAAKCKEMDAYDAASHIASETGILKELYTDKTPEGVSKHENIQELLNGIKDFTAVIDDAPKALENYLENVALLTDADNEDEDDFNKVTLMTIHSSKGLEFKNVHLVGVEEELFPSKMSSTMPSDLEEERRLFYVAITRAEKNATISYTVSRYKWGTLTNCQPSRFIREIDEKFVDLPEEDFGEKDNTFFERDNVRSFSSSDKKSFPKREIGTPTSYGSAARRPQPKFISKVTEAEKANFVPDNPGKLQPGMKVEHIRFGVGKILHLEGSAPNVKATVLFDKAGEKQLLLKFAKLKIVK